MALLQPVWYLCMHHCTVESSLWCLHPFDNVLHHSQHACINVMHHLQHAYDLIIVGLPFYRKKWQQLKCLDTTGAPCRRESMVTPI